MLRGKTNKFNEVKRVKDLTTVTWEVGPFKELSLGQPIESPLGILQQRLFCAVSAIAK
jgi:hypothetical protein